MLDKLQTELPSFVRTRTDVRTIMLDVIIALTPILLISCLAYGFVTLIVTAIAVISAVLAEFIFAWLILGRKDTVKDCSAIVTAMLLVFTIGPFVPWYVVAFGASMAVIFGKLLWGGVGQNRFNPALVGREFMAIYFPLVMTSGSIWQNKDLLLIGKLEFFGQWSDSAIAQYADSLIYKASGAIGEYSVLLLILGGIFLLVRRRISWYIPFGLLVTFVLLTTLFPDKDIQFSIAGILLGTIYMATDMPSSASSKWGKLYFGVMIGAIAFICLFNDVRYEYMSYSILIANGFVLLINQVFRPTVWGHNPEWTKRILKTVILTLLILATTYAVIFLHQHELIKYLVFGYIIYIILRFTIRMEKTK